MGTLLLALPAVIGIACLAAAIAVMPRRFGRHAPAPETAAARKRPAGMLAGFLLAVAFGIGACYAYFFFVFDLRS